MLKTQHLTSLFFKFKSASGEKIFVLNAAFAMTILDFISGVYLATFFFFHFVSDISIALVITAR